MLPGRTLHRLAARFCSERSLERIVEPAIADLQKEWSGGDRASRRARALLAGYAAIVKVMAICAVSVSVPSDDEWNALGRTLVWSVALVIATTALLMLAPLYEFHSAISGWYAVTMLVPQAVPLAIPIGVGLGIAFGLRAQHTVNTAKLMLLAAMAASVLSFGILAWAMPAGNQAFRENVVRELGATTLECTFAEVPKGYNEMSLTELRHEIAHFSAEGEPRRAREYAHHLHLRISLAVATLALGVLMLAAPVNHRGLRGLLALVACFVYWALIFVGESAYRQGYVTPPTAAWLPNVVLIAAAIVIASSRSSRPGSSPAPAR